MCVRFHRNLHLEACFDILFKIPASKDFDKALRKLVGNEPQEIPSPIIEGIIKLHSYRGSGKGVSHGSSEGNKVTVKEAELFLSLIGSLITYLYEISEIEDEIPF